MYWEGKPQLQEYLQYSDPLKCTDKDVDYMIFNPMAQRQTGRLFVPNTKDSVIQKYGKPEPFTVKECKTVRKFWKYTCNRCDTFGCSWHPWTCNGNTPDDDCCMKTSNYRNVEECTSIKGTAWKSPNKYMFNPDPNPNLGNQENMLYPVPPNGKVSVGYITHPHYGAFFDYEKVICGRNTDPFKQQNPPLLSTTKKIERRMSTPSDARSRKNL